MTAIVKEETLMENAAKTYLQMYQDHITGYKQYKMEKTATPALEHLQQPNPSEQASIQL